MLRRIMRAKLGPCGVFLLAVPLLAMIGACARGDSSATDTAYEGGAGDDDVSSTALDAGPRAVDGAAPPDTSVPVSDASDTGAPADALPDTPPVEAGCDASTPAQIPPTGTDNFQTIDARWAKAGSADINGAMVGWSELTPDSSSKAGALWWNASYLFDHFDVSFVFQIDNKSGGADGLAFAWVPGNDVTKVGNSGGGYGFTGIGGGWAIVVDTYQNGGEPAAPFLAVVDSSGTHLQRATIPNVRNGNGHTMRVMLQAPNVSVWVDGTAVVGALALTGYVPFNGHWGFTAATGSSTERHFVTGISMTFPDGQGCTP